jgi:hypothetical protein
MSTLSKSPNNVALIVYAIAKQSLPAYRHIKSPKKFSQHQLAALLVLREFFKTDYRGIEAILKDNSDLRKILELKYGVPHFSTIQKAAHRIKKKELDALFAGGIDLAVQAKVLKKNVALSAIDGTGFESRHVSSYFVKRRAKGEKNIYQTTKYTRYPKAGIITDCKTHLVVSIIPGRGAGPDIIHFNKAVTEAQKNVQLKILTADAGYDSERAHVFAREEYVIRTIIPPKIGRPTAKLPTGKWRKVMATRFNKKLYGQRWQVETVNSMVKRVLGSALRARSYWSQCREMMMRFLTHNIMILWG